MALTSKFGKIYQALKEHIKSEVPEIEWIDTDLGQLELYESRPAVKFPCVLIDFPTTEYKEKQQKTQHGQMQVSFKLGFAGYDATNSAAPVQIAEAGLQYFELEHKLYLALQDFNAGDELNIPLVRINAITQLRDDKFRVRIIAYKGTFQDDYAAEP